MLFRIALWIWPGEVTVSDRLLVMHYLGTDMVKTLCWRKRIVLRMAAIYYALEIKSTRGLG